MDDFKPTARLDDATVLTGAPLEKLESPTNGLELRRVDSAAGKTINNFKLLELLGRGAMGSVYRARHQLLDKDAAVKLLHPHLCSDEAAIKRFRQEAQSASRLEHRGIVRVSDFGVTPEAQPYLIMDFVDGVSLSNLIADRQLDINHALKLCGQICDALQEAHSKGVVHRDVKPSNIIVTNLGKPDEQIKVVDFGIAKVLEDTASALTQTGEAMGSPPYMSPEQCQAQTLDARSDIYSLGCVLYELISGVQPFQSNSIYEVVHHHLHSMPESIGKHRKDARNPVALDALVLKAMAKEPGKRFASANEFKSAIVTAQNQIDATQTWNSKAKAYLEVARARHNPKKIAIAVALTVFAGVGVFALSTNKISINAPQQTISAPEEFVMSDSDFDNAYSAAKDSVDKGDMPQAETQFRALLTKASGFGLEDVRVQKVMTDLAGVLQKENKQNEAKSLIAEVQDLQKFNEDRADAVGDGALITRLDHDLKIHPKDKAIRTQLLDALTRQTKTYHAALQRLDAISCADSVLSLTNADSAEDAPYRVRAFSAKQRIAIGEFNETEAAKALANIELMAKKHLIKPHSREMVLLLSARANKLFADFRAADSKMSEPQKIAAAKESLALSNEAAAITTALDGQSSPFLIDILMNKGAVNHQLNKQREGTNVFEKALALSEKYRGVVSQKTARAAVRAAGQMMALAKQLPLEGKEEAKEPGKEAKELAAKAKALLLRSEITLRRSTTQDAETMVILKASLGDATDMLGDYAAAESYRKQVINTTSEKFMPETKKHCVSNLLQMYQRQGRRQDIDALMRKLQTDVKQPTIVTDS